MEFVVSSASSYPRPNWFKEYLKKVEGLQKDVDAKIDENVLKRAQLEVIEKQKRNGVELFTDGMLIWHDFLATVALRLNFKPNGLARYFENNLYYRVPVLKSLDELRVKGEILYDFKLTAKMGFGKKMKAVLSCYTPIWLSKCDKKKSLKVIAEKVFEEINDVSKITDNVQLDEPAFVYSDTNSILEFLDLIPEFKVKLWIVTYFGGIDDRIYEKLLDCCSVVGLDFVEAYDRSIKLLQEYGCKELAAGIVDGRNTKMEKIEELKTKIEKILEFKPKKVYLTTNTGLEFLPEFKAWEKMRLLSKFKSLISSI